ncbi:uncharacterized protein [Coffea arabica]|uniref:Condensin-2 complex subunit G2-like n=1 Tax=Coffea arabica TaxID=13443 RepID=A0A6P6TJ98_COFAR|nr:uncharacterized protein LOC113701253 [Coffea arabica]
MEKRLRSSLKTSAEEFLSTAKKLGFAKSTKSTLKSLIYTLTPPSDLVSSLPPSLHRSISQSINKFKSFSSSSPQTSPQTPPTKRVRRSSRHLKSDDASHTTENEKKRQKESVVENLEIYTYIAFLCVTHPKGSFSAADLLPGVSELHDNLVIFESDSTLLSEIANLCEEWWKRNLPGKEALISQSLPFLLSRSLTLKKKVDVHRVYSLREAFILFDFEDEESIEDLKNLLMRCVISPLYFKTEEGRKFIAFIFGLSGQLVTEALAMIKSQIPFGRKSMLEAYGEIVFRAWKSVEGESKDEIENDFLQGLIESAIHASSPAFAASIRTVLGAFIIQRTTHGVEKLLFRLAEPVIFRSLQVANSNVRHNALHLLLDLFPLEDPDATKEVEDTLLDKQFFLVNKLLTDECPDVRVVAVEGGCRILNLFWEVIPTPSITKILTKIFDDLTHDNCTEVRFSTVDGIMYLLGNPHSHEVLKVLLPRMGHLILDHALSVRVAIMDLLLLVRDMRNFQFHKVVQLELLLSSLANDHPLVAQKITKLLIPSYFPSQVTQEEACNRFIALIRRCPVAGARFCEFCVSEGASLQSLKELFGVLIRLTLSSDRLDAQHMDGLLTAASHLCDNLVNDPSTKAAMKEEVNDEKLKRIFAAAPTTHAKSCVCKIVTAISPDAVDGLFKDCLGLIMNCSAICSDMNRQVELRSAHKMVLSCDWFDLMFDAMTKHLQKTAHDCHVGFGIEQTKFIDASAKRRKTKSTSRASSKLGDEKKRSSKFVKSRFYEDYAIATGIAWQIKELLLSENMRTAILTSRNLEAAFDALKVISEVSILQCLQCDTMSASPVLAYATLTLHMSLQHVSTIGNTHSSSREGECLDSSDSPLESISRNTVLDSTFNHLFNCTYKVVMEDGCVKYTDLQTDMPRPTHDGSSFIKPKRISNMLKVLTAVLKLIVDAISIEIADDNEELCMKFAMTCIKFMMFNLKKYSNTQLQFTEEGLRETFVCLRSSFTYVAKFLSLLLKNSSKASLLLPAPCNLANELFNLFASVEECLGYGYAARLITAVKPWVPDLILALGSIHLLKQTSGGTASDCDAYIFSLWTTTLAKIEFYELQGVASDEEAVRGSKSERFSALRKLLGIMVQLLRTNPDVLDAVGVIFLNGLLLGLDRKEFDHVLGILHFVCMKLVRHHEEWGGLKLMLASVQSIYPRIEVEAQELRDNADGRQLLKNARALLEPVWLHYLSGEHRNQMGED